jgi:hypothetical protein
MATENGFRKSERLCEFTAFLEGISRSLIPAPWQPELERAIRAPLPCSGQGCAKPERFPGYTGLAVSLKASGKQFHLGLVNSAVGEEDVVCGSGSHRF